MKKFRLLSVLLVMFSVLSLASCDSEPVDPVLNGNENENENPNPENPGVESFTADYNGATHTAINTSAVAAQDMLQIVAILGSNGESIMLGVFGDIAVGTTYGADDLLMAYHMNAQDQLGFLNENGTETSGELKITAINAAAHTISGSFSFTAWSATGGSAPIVFTNGQFSNIPYSGTITGGEIPVEQENIFKAKVDGELHDYTNVDVSVIVSGEEGHRTIAIVGQDGGETFMSLVVYSDYSAGTYNIGSSFGDPSADFTSVTIDENSVSVDNGIITVTSNANGRIKGTFNYLVKNEAGETIYTVTDGQFDVEWDF